MLCDTCKSESGVGIVCDCGKQHCGKCYPSHVCPKPAPRLWPHQTRGINELRSAIDGGETAICLTSPTGGGKTRLASEIVKHARENGKRVVLYVHRRMLLSQTSRKMQEHKLDHGLMAAGYDPALLRDVQIASIQTIDSRVIKQEKWELHMADIVIVDEAHDIKAERAQKILNQHREMGAVIIGLTATPVGIGHIYNRIIVAGTKNELRKCGALVPCETYGPDEPDLKHIGSQKIQFSEREQAKVIMVRKVFGRVFDNWKRLNPDGRPTLLFAPGVRESRWFARMFNRRGVTAAHIDGDTPDDERQQILEGSQEGTIKVVSNRLVLREGIDAPWLEHCILACVIGSYSSFVQAGGRMLRASPDTGKTKAIIQDHGGHWWRHGSLNDDMEWTLENTDQTIATKKRKSVTEGGEKEPVCCPECSRILRPSDYMSGGCLKCGHKFKQSQRMVVQVNGELKLMRGAVRKKKKPVDNERVWNGCFWQAVNAHKDFTLRQIAKWFYGQAHSKGVRGHPPYGAWNCPAMESADWERYVRDVYPRCKK